MSLFFTEFHNGQRKIFDLLRKKGYNIRQERRTMEDTKNLNTEFQSNLEYVLTNLEKDILQASNLEDKLYLEMSKDEIIDSLNYVYKIIKCWENSYNNKQYKNIINKYSEIESIVSKFKAEKSKFIIEHPFTSAYFAVLVSFLQIPVALQTTNGNPQSDTL